MTLFHSRASERERKIKCLPHSGNKCRGLICTCERPRKDKLRERETKRETERVQKQPGNAKFYKLVHSEFTGRVMGLMRAAFYGKS
jgi:hypothetical protein